jgi:hypothetical protein
MKRRWIDVDTTARMWALNESIGKSRRSLYLTNEGVQAVFKEVALRSVVNEGPALDKLRGWNQKANAFVGKAIDPVKQKAGEFWNSATNKVTYDKLDMNWRRDAKLDKEASVDSMDVVKFLKDQGVKAPLINASFKALGLQEPTLTGAVPTAQGDGAAAGFAQGLLGANGAQVANAINAYQGTKGGVPKRVAGTNTSTATAATAADTTATAEKPPAVWKNNRNLGAPAATSPQAAAPKQPGATDTTATSPTTAKLPTATGATAGQPSKVTYDPKMFAKKAAAPNFNALSTAAGQGYKTAQPTVTPTTATTPATTPTDATATAKTRTGGKVAGQLSQTPNAIRKRTARANTTTTPSAFGNMASQLAARPTASSTGGTTKGVAGVGNGVVSHTASPNNPNLQPATTAATKTTAPQTANPFAGLGQQSASTFTGRQPKKAKAAEPVAEARVDFGAMLFNRMKKQS